MPEEGVEVTNVEDLRTHVVTAIRELRLEDAFAAKGWRGWRLEVTDRSGTVLLTADLDLSRPEIIAGLPFSTLVFLKCGELSEHLANVIPYELAVLST